VIEIFGDIDRAQIGGRFAGVEGVFVELKLLALNTAENHRGESAVADGERVGPDLRGFVIVQTEWRRCRRRFCGGSRQRNHENEGEGERDNCR
jgi:hypothetical protein